MEIHPETPAQGRLLTELFRSGDIDRMMEHLRVAAAQFGITFVDRPFLSNSRPALQAAEFARELGRFNEFHTALFAAYFSQGLDIGNHDVLAQIAVDLGLDGGKLRKAVESGTYLPRLAEAREEASRFSVTGVPTFVIGEKKTVVGAQPLDVFRKILGSIG